MVQQRPGNSGWVDTIWTFSLGLVGAASALWPVAGSAPNARQWLVAALVAIWSLRLGVHIAVRTSGITDDPRYAAFASDWGLDAPRKMFIFLQNQGFGSIPLVLRFLSRRVFLTKRCGFRTRSARLSCLPASPAKGLPTRSSS